MLHGTFDNANYFTFTLNACYYKGYLVDEEEYKTIIQSKIKPKGESRKEKKERFNYLLNKNNWSRAELSRHLGCSRAWVTIVLKD